MAENPLLDKLDGIESRFEETATLITDPDVIADRERYVRLSKEYRELQKLTDAARQYRTALSDLDDAKNILASESDPELRGWRLNGR